MNKKNVIIIGAGTSGLTARREVARHTDDYLVIDDGPLGTTCARVGCMPSKVFIQVASDFERRKKLSIMGIRGGENLSIDTQLTMKHVRALRDRFVKGVKEPMINWEDKLIRGKAKFLNPYEIEVNNEIYKADKFIIATGSSPFIPDAWLKFKSFLITTDQFFELNELPESIGVIGLGVIGLELGQALSRLGIKTVAFNLGKEIGGVSDPEIQDYLLRKMNEEFQIELGEVNITEVNENNLIVVESNGKKFEFQKLLVAIGRKPNFKNLGLENLNLDLSKLKFPEVNPQTLELKGFPHIFMPGDINGFRPLLHEAADEGVIAGFNSVHETECFKRRTPLAITFSDPSIAIVGQRFKELKDKNIDFVTGSVSFEGQGRSIVKLSEKGMLHVYVDKENGLILGAEIYGPDAEHLGHLLAWSISLKLTVFEAVKMPFYHPVIEEGLRTALRDGAMKVKKNVEYSELFRCGDVPIR